MKPLLKKLKALKIGDKITVPWIELSTSQRPRAGAKLGIGQMIFEITPTVVGLQFERIQ